MPINSFLQRYIESKQLTEAEAEGLSKSDKELLEHFSAQEILNNSSFKVSEVLEAGFRNLEALALDDTGADKGGFDNLLMERVINGLLDIRFAYCPPLDKLVRDKKISLASALDFTEEEKDILALSSTKTLLEKNIITLKKVFRVGRETLLMLASNTSLLKRVVKRNLNIFLAFCPPLQRFINDNNLSICTVNAFSEEQKAILSLGSAKKLLKVNGITVNTIFSAGLKNLQILDSDESLLARVLAGRLHLYFAFCPPLQRFLDNKRISALKIMSLSEAEKDLLSLDASKKLLGINGFTVRKILSAGARNMQVLNSDEELLAKVRNRSLSIHLAFCPPLHKFVRDGKVLIGQVKAFSEEARDLLSLDSAKQLMQKAKLMPSILIEAGFKNLQILDADSSLLEQVMEQKLDPQFAFCPPLYDLFMEDAITYQKVLSFTELDRELLSLGAAKTLLEKRALTFPSVMALGFKYLKKLDNDPPLLKQVLRRCLPPC